MAVAPTTLQRRQIWANPTPSTSPVPHSCSPYRLPSGGTLHLVAESIITLTYDAVFTPHCPDVTRTTTVVPHSTGADLSVLEKQDPFYTSTNPLIYAISSATIISYMLVIILFATPRTFYVGGAGGGVSVLGRKGTMGGSYGSNTVIGIGSRPWLQKIAASTLAISMTIVTADAFRFAEIQYEAGYENAEELTRDIINGLEIKIVRLISETFLWLAQAQTLIRLFQRHREKFVIKWIAFLLISLEVIFTILNHFVREGHQHQPRSFANSIPALNYLFALALNICYAAFVIVFALRKRRFAFFHSQMHSMPLMALLSLTAVLIPVVFFILDLSKPDVSGWGSYVRWVGACAASVVVWEWVERIEALEREEKKDGILGREVFDGDEMLADLDTKDDLSRPPGDGGGHQRTTLPFENSVRSFMRGLPGFNIVTKQKKSSGVAMKTLSNGNGHSSNRGQESAPDPSEARRGRQGPSELPPTVASPVSRADSSSAASTVYAVRYHPTTEPTPPILEDSHAENTIGHDEASRQEVNNRSPTIRRRPKTPSRLSRIPIPFRRQRQTPPAEVAAALAEQHIVAQTLKPPTPTLLDRLHLRRHQHNAPMPSGVIFVPAPPRRGRPIIEDVHDESAETFNDSDDDASGGGEDRPPATVRNALRRSNNTTPAMEHGQSPPIVTTGESAGSSPQVLGDHQEDSNPQQGESLDEERRSFTNNDR